MDLLAPGSALTEAMSVGSSLTARASRLMFAWRLGPYWRPQPAREPRLRPRRAGHQCLSWTISGADDKSSCCEQSKLRIVPRTCLSPPHRAATSAWRF